MTFLKRHIINLLLVAMVIISFLTGKGVIGQEWALPSLVVTIVFSFFRIDNIFDTSEKKWNSIADNIEDFRSKLRAIAEEKRLVEVVSFRNRDDFYADLNQTLTKTTHSIKLTAIRENAPNEIQTSGYSNKWYEAVVNWAKQSPGKRVVHRVASVGNERMLKWVEEDALRLEKEGVRNFFLHKIKWDAQSNLPVVNVCIFDEKVVYLIYTPINNRMEESSFLRIDSSTAAELFMNYYRDLKDINSESV